MALVQLIYNTIKITINLEKLIFATTNILCPYYLGLNCSLTAIPLILEIQSSLKELTCSVHLIAIDKINIIEEVAFIMPTRAFASEVY